jgi:dsDNA-specific endonuclease/ATPase MutS2
MTLRRPDPDQPLPALDPTEGEGSPVVLPIDDALDLHSFAPRDIPDVVRDYLEECVTHGFLEVRLIHGRGTGIQRRIVRSVLTGHPLVEAFADAPPERGGWGATVVRLREGPHTTHNGQ